MASCAFCHGKLPEQPYLIEIKTGIPDQDITYAYCSEWCRKLGLGGIKLYLAKMTDRIKEQSHGK